MARHTWSPPWAPHVEGYYDDRTIDEETKLPEEAEVGARCTKCGQTFKRMCASGLMRNWIARFAHGHLHRDVLNDPAPPR